MTLMSESFGWELFCWQGLLRDTAKSYDMVIVGCRTNHDFIYRDFATSIYNYDPRGEETDMWKNHSEANYTKLQDFVDIDLSGAERVTLVRSDAYKRRWWIEKNHEQQVFKRFESNTGELHSAAVVLHIRSTDKCDTDFRNWPVVNAMRLVKFLSEQGHISPSLIACVGRSDSSAYVEGTQDWRDIPLDELAARLNRSGVLVGSQSGVHHFGALCGIPIVCWQTCREHAKRVKDHWNPFNVPCVTIPSPDDMYWRRRLAYVPSVEDVASYTLQTLENPWGLS